MHAYVEKVFFTVICYIPKEYFYNKLHFIGDIICLLLIEHALINTYRLLCFVNKLKEINIVFSIFKRSYSN
jgi:hypothetical protein